MANDLEPARFERKKERAFAPKLPWKIIVPVGLVLVGMIGFYQWRERSKAHQLRQEIGASYQAHVVPVRERIESFRGVLEGWVMEAAANEEGPESWADPRLNLAGLHRAQGIYLRIHADQATDPESIAEAARIMGPDAIARCLGLSPTSLRGFYDRLQFLDPAWLEDVEEADSVLRLRVLDEQLKNRVERDLPLMLDAQNADYFMLVVQHGENRREHPVDVYLWDVRRRQPLLRTRAQARGTYIPVRIAIGNTGGGRAQPLPQRAGMIDCSLASQIRGVAGAGVAEVESEMPEAPEPAAEGAEGEAVAGEEAEGDETAGDEAAGDEAAGEERESEAGEEAAGAETPSAASSDG
ncbi:MAG TPA: hypothetical protein RMH85_32305 [Polyangiaceae bacterium LLY-WYZ-15_(1-7)]|nr:hypothetical protein [Polyangiaceae bacterium LLY-WYZ-15_(1-7)]HJL13211.1 hypothetical protein [Polyangiaceae bacterium LLY-WYZ-15_(1-7)]HJL34771.1 hypothetical protein [Polyangiaceae bacterium LLY-WYZ-15_(1-7)]HJL49848.1 hypothetical protein [Polyangiaceae bacterium LLY-WYZ-15_(1-7)]